MSYPPWQMQLQGVLNQVDYRPEVPLPDYLFGAELLKEGFQVLEIRIKGQCYKKDHVKEIC